MTLTRLGPLSLALALLLTPGCGGEDDVAAGGDGGSGAVDGAASSDGGGHLASQSIGATGGTVIVPSLGFSLTFPPGALAAPTIITVDGAADVPMGIPGKTVELGPSGTQFALPVRAHFSFSALPVGVTADRLRVYTRSLASDPWVALATQLDAGGGGAAADLMHFSGAGLGAAAPAGMASASMSFFVTSVGTGSGDLGGLAASLFLRGIELWQVPTTLLAMADSAVGGKTAINLPEGKNLVGTVHPAAQVLIDLEFTTTESATHIHSGLAEAVKMAIGCDAQLFDLLQAQASAVKSRDLDVLQEVVRLAVAAKIGIVERDLLETGERRLLNLGHTLGHALEAHSGWTLPHGLAVARGLFFALDVAAALAAIAPADASRCRALLQVHGYTPEPLPPAAELLPFLRRDKKASGDVLHFAVPTGIGRSEVRPLPIAWLAERLGACTGDNPATTRQ